MNKLFLLLMMCMAALTVNAQVFIENFETAPIGGNLEGYNDWYVSFKAGDANGESPKIEEQTLFFTGYAGSDIGNVAVLDSLIGVSSATQRISTKVVTLGSDTLMPTVGGKMYAAFMVQIFANSYGSYRDFFTWEASTGSSFTRGRVFAKVSNGKSDINFAVSKNSSSSGVYVESETYAGAVEQIFLLVLTYEAVEGDANDIVSLYINPDPTKTEAEQTGAILIATDAQSDYTPGSSKIKINLRQRAVSAYIGGIRVGTDWTQVVTGTGSAVKNIESSASGITSFGKTIVTNVYGKVNVYNLAGREVLSGYSNGKFETSLNRGIYLVRFVDDKGTTLSGKVAIK